jgi:hypothetical protein
MNLFWLRITCLFVAALGADAMVYQLRTGDLVEPTCAIFVRQHPRARRPLIWITTVLFGAGIAFLLYAAVAAGP